MTTRNWFQIAVATIGEAFSYCFGGWDAALITLVVFASFDIFTGLIKGAIKKKLSSQVCYKGLLRKVGMFFVVAMAQLLDVNVFHTDSVLRTAMTFYFIANEGISICENLSQAGVPMPKKLLLVLEQLQEEGEK